MASVTLEPGDTDYVAKLNSNFSGLDESAATLDSTKQNVAAKGQANGYASLNADGAVPGTQLALAQLRSEKGVASGYASLDSSGHIPQAQLPVITTDQGLQIDLGAFQPTAQKDAINGYAGLDASGKLKSAEFPSTVELTSRKAVANGYCDLDGDVLIPVARIPDLSDTYASEAELAGYIPIAAEGAALGVAQLDENGRIPVDQMGEQPVMAAAFYPGLPGNGALILAFLPTSTVSIPANLANTRVKVGTNPSGDVTISVKKNGTQIGAITVHSDGSFTLPTCSAASITDSDELTAVAPSPADASMADVRITVYGTR